MYDAIKLPTIPPFCGVIFNVLLVSNKSGLSHHHHINTGLTFLGNASSLGAKIEVTREDDCGECPLHFFCLLVNRHCPFWCHINAS